jgi:hypothetical protein
MTGFRVDRTRHANVITPVILELWEYLRDDSDIRPEDYEPRIDE